VINLQDGSDRTAAAGEYVLGTLGTEDQALFVRALAQDPALRAEVLAWQDRLLGLSAGAAPVTPSLELWRRVDSSAAAAWSVRTERAARPRWWQRTRLWQGFSAVVMAAWLTLALRPAARPAGTAPLPVPVTVPVRAPPPAPATGTRYLAVLQSPDSLTAGWVVEVQAGGRLRLVPIAPIGVIPAGRSMQLWTRAPGATTATPLGLVRAGRTLDMKVTHLPDVQPQQSFELTLEAEDGSSAGRPTGPILYVGQAVAL
jgi:anti-sigma-K factor RskA